MTAFPLGFRRAAAVAGGAAVGTALRAGAGAAAVTLGLAAPWATIGVNLVGSLALGFVLGRRISRAAPGGTLVAFVGVGLLGSFTTFSSFAAEVAVLLRSRPVLGTGYAVAAPVTGLLLARVGRVLGEGR